MAYYWMACVYSLIATLTSMVTGISPKSGCSNRKQEDKFCRTPPSAAPLASSKGTLSATVRSIEWLVSAGCIATDSVASKAQAAFRQNNLVEAIQVARGPCRDAKLYSPFVLPPLPHHTACKPGLTLVSLVQIFALFCKAWLALWGLVGICIGASVMVSQGC